jgi:outer membrane lipoprotein LolB
MTRLLCVLTAAALLAGCAGLRPATPGRVLDAEAERALLQGLDGYGLAGRIGIAARGEGVNAQIELDQRGTRSLLQLRSSLGIGSLRVESDGERFSLQSSRGESLDGAVARDQLAQRLGFEPPLSSLRYWVLGVPDPAMPSEPLPGDAGGARGFLQRGWRIEATELSGHRAGDAQVGLPRRVTLTAPDVRVRLVVNRWHLDPGASPAGSR